jgi:hypothetical protein
MTTSGIVLFGIMLSRTGTGEQLHSHSTDAYQGIVSHNNLKKQYAALILDVYASARLQRTLDRHRSTCPSCPHVPVDPPIKGPLSVAASIQIGFSLVVLTTVIIEKVIKSWVLHNLLCLSDVNQTRALSTRVLSPSTLMHISVSPPTAVHPEADADAGVDIKRDAANRQATGIIAKIRACKSLRSMLCFEPVHGCRHAEHAHEGAFGLLTAGRDGAPLFQSRPAALDQVAVGVDPGRAGHRGLVALGRNGRTRAEVPDEPAERLRGVTTIGHDPQRQSRAKAQQNRRHWQFIGLSGREGEANRPAGAVRYDTSFGGEAAARAAKRFTLLPLR